MCLGDVLSFKGVTRPTISWHGACPLWFSRHGKRRDFTTRMQVKGKVMGILIWILFGLVVGVLVVFLMSEPSPQGSAFAILLGIAGAIVGGFLGQLLGFYQSGESASFLMAVIGSITLLELYTVLIRGRL